MFDTNEKTLLKELVKRELENFEKEESTIIEKSIPEVKVEAQYDEFLKTLLKKLEWVWLLKRWSFDD